MTVIEVSIILWHLEQILTSVKMCEYLKVGRINERHTEAEWIGWVQAEDPIEMSSDSISKIKTY